MGIVSGLFRNPSTLLGHLAIPGCDSVRYTEFDTWHFPCGLEISDKLVRNGGVGFRTSHVAHRWHHEQGHTSRDWQLITTLHIAEEGRSETHALACDCEARGRANVDPSG